MPEKKILVVEDEEGFRGVFESAAEQEFLKRFFGETNEVRMLIAASVAEAVEILKFHPIDLLLTDMELGPNLGWEIIAEVKKLAQTPILAVMSGRYEFELAAKEQGIVFFEKPFSTSFILGWMKEQLFPEIIKISSEKE